MLFALSSKLPCDQASAFQYHERAEAQKRLLPPCDKVEIVQQPSSLHVGQRAILKQKIFGVPTRWVAEHIGYDKPNLFVDTQLAGPFALFTHQHRFEAINQSHSKLTDHIDYQISKFSLLGKLASGFVESKLDAMFRYRHRVTIADLDLMNRLNSPAKRLIISGSTGFLGQRICALANVLGHHVVRLNRVENERDLHKLSSADSTHDDGASQASWHVKSGKIVAEEWIDCDAFIHLAGASIAGHRWTDDYKKELYSSRVDATKKLIAQLRADAVLPAVIVTASGGGIYPDSNDRWLDEGVPHGKDFLGKLAADWEAASSQTEADGTRWCAGRLAMVLDPLDGAMVPLLRQLKAFAGGQFGDGKMVWSWIERDDAASAFLWMALQSQCSGPFNLSGVPVNHGKFMQQLGQTLQRPVWARIPKSVVRVGIGQMADELLFKSTRLANRKLLEAGFQFRCPTLQLAFEHLLK